MGDQQDYGMRIYDPRVGRFLSVDPLTPKYPELTPYQFASNTPIQAVDLDGKEAALINYSYRGTLILLTGSAQVGAGVDIHGNVGIYFSWSAGIGTGAYLGGGLGVTIYPTAKVSDLMGSGMTFGANAAIPGLSGGLELDLSFVTDDKGNVTGTKVGGAFPLKAGSLGPGGLEIHWDYSQTYPLVPIFNINDPDKILNAKQQVMESTGLDEKVVDEFFYSILTAEKELQKTPPSNPVQSANQNQTNKSQSSSDKTNLGSNTSTEKSTKKNKSNLKAKLSSTHHQTRNATSNSSSVNTSANKN